MCVNIFWVCGKYFFRTPADFFPVMLISRLIHLVQEEFYSVLFNSNDIRVNVNVIWVYGKYIFDPPVDFFPIPLVRCLIR